jgi:hypothetical protein
MPFIHAIQGKDPIMDRMTNILPAVLFLLIVSVLPLIVQAGEDQGSRTKKGADALAAGSADKSPVYPTMPSAGNKVPIDKDHYIIYGFDKKPKLGTIILKIEVFAKDVSKDTTFEVLGDSGMPSMKGAHETGEQPFRLSNKGAYLLPVNIVMPGDWEIRITIKKNGKVLFRGSHQFDV